MIHTNPGKRIYIYYSTLVKQSAASGIETFQCLVRPSRESAHAGAVPACLFHSLGSIGVSVCDSKAPKCRRGGT